MIVLGIESSCDETGLALYDQAQGLLGDVLYSQIQLHREFGGVVPELASRDHVNKLLPLLDELLAKTQKTLADIDAVAYTQGPGLAGALLVGASMAKTLALMLDKPAIAVHHMEGHLLAPMIKVAGEEPSLQAEFPLVALLVSGGHTQLVDVANLGEYELLGESLDDAAGEAFDKAAKMLGLSYPGGPAIAQIAQQGDEKRFDFPRPMTNRPGLDFSFSGIKTFTLTTIESLGGSLHDVSALSEQDKADVAASFQRAMVDTLVIKCKRALAQTGYKQLMIAGGVSANTLLRESLEIMLNKVGGEVFYAPLALCTDNGAMIAYAGMQRLNQADVSLGVSVKPRWPLVDLPPVESVL